MNAPACTAQPCAELRTGRAEGIAAAMMFALVLTSDADSLEAVGSVASLGRSLGSGIVVSEAVLSEVGLSEAVLSVAGSLELAVLGVVLLEVGLVLVGLVGVAARGSNLAGTLTGAGGCGALSEALGTRIGTALIGSKDTLS